MGQKHTMGSKEIRKAFLDFFSEKKHVIVPSAPIVVKNDPTLMFTNAGMNQFKDLFLGNETAPWPRAADSQKCLRVSGKHNDLEEVGRDTYHHTMFEMLGNWSFGDYFKKEAIEWAWELLVTRLGLEPERIYATVFGGSTEEGVERDEEAFAQWKRFLPEERILDGSKKDNFWEMGDTGPCGPCSEIHYDLRDEQDRAALDGRTLVNADHPLVIEIWNLVFMQFNRMSDGSLEPLPARHVDTGMGFERLCMILQGKKSNYDTDLFQPLIGRIAELSAKQYGTDEMADISMRVIADHLRAVAFCIADGQLPSNVKAGYVVRRILRRAVRYGYTYLDIQEPFIWKLVDTLASVMGEQYEELYLQKELIEKVIMEEEASFLRTLSTGINLLESVIEKIRKGGGSSLSGRDAFVLYDTYGFPIDLTGLIARENGMEVELGEFEKELAKQKERSRSAAAVDTGDWIELIPGVETEFTGYDKTEEMTRIARYREVTTKGKKLFQLVFDRTPFYGNSGGQVGDTGFIEQDGRRITVIDTQKENNLTVHITTELPDDLTAEVKVAVNIEKREAAAANHTATHLLHEALREVLGTHVEQKGSLVSADHLRFDFAHFQKVSDEELMAVEKLVNRRVRANLPLDEIRHCDMDTARDMGAIMLFGEKYGSSVRVVRFGSSVELCGGTHSPATGSIGLFKIVSESAISAGVRRIEAVTGARAEEFVNRIQFTLREIQNFVNNPQIIQSVRKVFEENEGLVRQVEQYRKERVAELVEKLSADAREEDGMVLVTHKAKMPVEMVKDMAFALRQRLPRLVMITGTENEGKATLAIMLGEDIVQKGVNASEVIRTAAREIEGGGGGQPFFATAGGKKPEGLDAAMQLAAQLIKEKVNG